MPHGYNGKILHVDLTSGRLEDERPAESFYRMYMGGSALGLYYVLHHTPANTDPLGPDNTLVLALSGLTGTPISGQSRMTAVAKSPLTGAIGDSQCGGYWPAEMKFAGYDAIVITGKSEKPVYLWIRNGKAELREASHIWGKITGEAEKLIRDDLGDQKVEVLQCGPAGEKGVRFAALINMSNRANGRTGMGAVMGSKLLKAVVVRGDKRPSIADESKLKSLARWGAKNFPESDIAGLGKYGTAEIVGGQNTSGGLPTRNWESGFFTDAVKISGETMYDTILRGAPDGQQERKGRDSCYACTVRCKRVTDSPHEFYPVDPLYGGPEYETVATFGSFCGVSDLQAIAYANQLCNQYGMDTISCGATIAWAMDCFEKGLISIKDTNGIPLNFGNADAMIQVLEKIAKRDGFGDLLAEGSARAAKKYGTEAEKLVVTVKNQELPAHMPQVKRSLGLIYAVNPYGADHQASEHDPVYEGDDYQFYKERLGMLGLNNPQEEYSLNEHKIQFALQTERLYSFLDSINVCQFVFGPAWQLYGPDQLVEVTRAVTGWDDLTLDELLEVGERRINLLRVFNAREGFTREQDRLPDKMWKNLSGGTSDGLHLDKMELEIAKDVYYRMSGWEVRTGNPSKQILSKLGLDWVENLVGP